jgi:hypothetical protein
VLELVEFVVVFDFIENHILSCQQTENFFSLGFSVD